MNKPIGMGQTLMLLTAVIIGAGWVFHADAQGVAGSGTLTDTRDGKTYKTVTIGKQTWMAKNLNYAASSGSWCYEHNSSNCNTYGSLYDWNTAKMVCPAGWHLPSRAEWDDLMRTVGGEKKKYDGRKEIAFDLWDGGYGRAGIAFDYWDGAGKKLKSTSGWTKKENGRSGNGTDNYGFSALPGGHRLHSDPIDPGAAHFYSVGNYGYWWAAADYSDRDAYLRTIYYDYVAVYEYRDIKSNGFSVRCVADRRTTR